MKKIIAIVGFFGFFAAQTTLASAAYFNTTPLPRCETNITKTLQIGSENNDVIILQRLLVNAGYLSTHPNGYFGRQTASAVRMFQRDNEIAATGIVGASTRNAVNERLCDTSLVDNNHGYYQDSNYPTGVTYVTQNDPFVTVISPTVISPSVYATPQNVVTPSTTIGASSFVVPQGPSQIASTGIVYNPSTGYTYGIVPQSGSVTVGSPVANNVYQEGDTVYVAWTTNNIQTAPYSILLESSITGQSKLVAVVGGTSYSFVLTKELLDSVCSGICNNNQQGSFRVVVTMPTTDIAGITSTLRAAIAPITIKRPLSLGLITITSSKTPLSSGEIFKLYVNVPTVTGGTNTSIANYSVRIKSICPPSVSASIAGVPCGQEFILPTVITATQQEIPAMITNVTWYKQDVTFQINVVNLLGQTIGTAETKVTANAAPFSW